MKLTPEQEEEIKRQRRADRSRRNFQIELTARQSIEREELIRVEESGREDNRAMARRQLAARNERGFRGELRRAMPRKFRGRLELAETVGLDPNLLEQFYLGQAELTSSDVDRLTESLGLQLVRAESHRTDPS